MTEEGFVQALADVSVFSHISPSKSFQAPGRCTHIHSLRKTGLFEVINLWPMKNAVTLSATHRNYILFYATYISGQAFPSDAAG